MTWLPIENYGAVIASKEKKMDQLWELQYETCYARCLANTHDRIELYSYLPAILSLK